MNKFKTAALTFKLGWAVFKMKRDFKKAEKEMAKARKAEQRAKERLEAAAVIESNLKIERNHAEKES